MIGCCSGQAVWLAAAAGLPNRCREAAVIELIGFQSAMVRSQAGMRSVGTKVLPIMVIGKINGPRLSMICSFLTASPIYLSVS